MQLCYLVSLKLVLVILLSHAMAVFLQQEYNTEVTLYCDTAGTGNTTKGDNLEVVNRYWLLPDGRLVHQTSDLSDKFELGANFTLSVRRIADEDFGKYFCLLVLNDSSLFIHRHGLNVEGVAYDSLKESYARRAIIGTVAAAGLLVFMLLCAAFTVFSFQRKQREDKCLPRI